MPQRYPSSSRRRRLLLLLLSFWWLVPAAHATHLLGGEASYRYLGLSGTSSRPFRYEITFSIYINCEQDVTSPATFSNVPYGRAGIGVSIYDRTTRQLLPDARNPNGTTIDGTNVLGSNGQNADPAVNIQAGLYPFRRTTSSLINLPLPTGCQAATGCVRQVIYTDTVEVPVSVRGYDVIYSDVARNNTITNLSNPTSTAQLLHVYMPAGPLEPNRSPVFTDTTVVMICAGADTISLNNNAFDPDGDQLTYSFYTPYDRSTSSGYPLPLNPVDYAFGYSLQQPFGAGGFSNIDPATGGTRYVIPNPGDYVVGIMVREHRLINGRDSVISSVQREVLLKARACSPAPVPQLVAQVSASYLTITEGDTLRIPISAAPGTAGNFVRLRVSSPLLDGPGGQAGTFVSQTGSVSNVTVTLTGTNTIGGVFRYYSRPGSAGTYQLNMTASELLTCPPRVTARPVVINVRPLVTGRNADHRSPTLQLAPNPTLDGRLIAHLTAPASAPVRLTVRTVLGQVVSRQTLDFAQTTAAPLDLSALPRGLYLLTTESADPALNGHLRVVRD